MSNQKHIIDCYYKSLFKGIIIGLSDRFCFTLVREPAFADLILSPISPNCDPAGVKDMLFAESQLVFPSSLRLESITLLSLLVENSPSKRDSSDVPPNSSNSVAKK